MNKIKLLNFTNISLDEKKMILEWRNNPLVSKWMYNKDEIKLEDHLSFIDSLKSKKDKLYYLVKEESNYIGVIDFVDINNNSLFMGIYANPNLKGYGKTLMKIIIDYSFDKLNVNKIIAEVYYDNKKAYELYKNFGFQDIKVKLVNNEKVMCMELLR